MMFVKIHLTGFTKNFDKNIVKLKKSQKFSIKAKIRSDNKIFLKQIQINGNHSARMYISTDICKSEFLIIVYHGKKNGHKIRI